MRVSMLAFGVLLLVFGGWLVAAGPADDLDKELKAADGDYVMVSGEMSGKQEPEQVVKAATLTIEGTKHTAKVGEVTIVGTHKVDRTKTPKEIEATDTEGPYKGKTYLGVYKLEKGELTVFFAPPGKDRPKAIAAKTEPGEILQVWKKK